MDYAEKMNRCHLYVEALEEEKRKIQVFQRELPLCLELVTQAIEACKKELSGTTTEYNMQGQTQSECSEEEQTSSEGPVAVLEQFMPLKRSCSFDHDDDDDDDDNNNNKNKNTSDKKKSEWLRSVQLWNQSPDPTPKEDAPRKTVVMEVKRNGGAFQPFQKGKSIGKVNNNSSVPSAETSSTGGNSGNSQKEEKEGQNQRKQRRCWSPELHRRFLHSLQQLGGSHAATPKQIRELMKVDGLTNDEVKSHLQKYRLHTRRPSQTAHNNGNPQAPQFVVVGGIWVPPPEYAAVATTTASGEAASVAAPNGIYAPVATVPQASPSLAQRPQKAQSEHLHSEERSSHNAGGVHSNSPATSSCTHTSTASPVK